MSPSEHELRAALRHGDGEPVDADGIITTALARRRTRRTRAAAITSAVIVVAAVAVTVGVVGSRGSSSRQSAGSPEPATPVVSGQGSAGSGSCPATAPAQLMSPGGIVPGINGPLFPVGVTSMTICIYPSDLEQDKVVTSQAVSGADAARIAAEINALAPRADQPCADVVGRTVLIRAGTAAGPVRDVIGTTSGCGRITNGSYSRVGGAFLRRLAGGPGSGVATGGSGTVGSGRVSPPGGINPS